MILAAAALWLVQPKPTGLTRVLDKRARAYSVHLEVEDGQVESVSDYTLELGPEPPPKPDKKTKEVEKPKPGSYLLRLTDLRWKAGELTRRAAVFGAGPLSFEADGFPSSFLDPHWILAPLLGFYLPPSDSPISTDLPIGETVVGDGWKLVGKGNFGAPGAKGQSVSVQAVLTSTGGTTCQLDSDSLMDPKTGWPLECHGTIQGALVTVTYTAKLRR